MKKILLAAAGAVTAALTVTSGVAHATDILLVDPDNGIPWSWATQGECQSNGPSLRLADFHEDNVYRYWFCAQGDNGLWYLHNTDNPVDGS